MNDDRSLWQCMLDTAKHLPPSELKKHALVSYRNNHRCKECFCCACLNEAVLLLSNDMEEED